MMKRLVLFPVALMLISAALAQTGKEFWFAVPYVDKSHDKNNGDNKQTGPNYFRISTGEAGARVEFYNFPGGNAASRNELLKFTIPANSIETVSLVDGATDPATKKISLTTLSSDNVYNTILNKGLYIEASNPVTIYYEIGAYNNTEIFALKGFDALGTEFYPSFQNKFENELQLAYATDSWESIDIVATQDGTDVTIDLPTGTTGGTDITDEYRYYTKTYGGNIISPNGLTECWKNWVASFIIYNKTEHWVNGVKTGETYTNPTYLVDTSCLVGSSVPKGCSCKTSWNGFSSGAGGAATITKFHDQFTFADLSELSSVTDSIKTVTYSKTSFTGIGTTTISMNAGQTYSLKSALRTAIKPFDGIHVTATKPISITTKDDGAKDGSAADVVGDQSIPVHVAGFKYIVPDFNTGAGMEQCVFVRALYDGTEINIAGKTNPVATLNKGEIFSFSGFSKNDTYKYIYGSDSLKPFMCFHVAGYPSGGAGTDTELAGAMLPPVDQYTGSMQASFNQPQTTSKIVLLSRTNQANTFKYKKEGSAIWGTVNPTFTPVNIGGRTWYASFDLISLITPTPGDNYLVKNTKSVFHLGILSRMEDAGSYGSFYGYFSDYSKESLQASFDTLPGGQVVLFASGGSEGTYDWKLDKPAPVAATCAANYFDPVSGYPACGQENPIYLSTDILSNPGTYKYKVTATSPYGEVLTTYIQFKVESGKAIFVPLPVTFLNISAKYTGSDMVNVSWSTATETINHYFTVERANSSWEFEPVATVAGAGNSSVRNNYSFTDATPSAGVYYYRIRQTDYDGNSSYSETVAVRVGHADEPILVFPTLASPGQTIYIDPEIDEDIEVTVNLISIDGQCLYSGIFNYIGNAITVSAPMLNGVYKISVEFGSQINYKTIIVNP